MSQSSEKRPKDEKARGGFRHRACRLREGILGRGVCVCVWRGEWSRYGRKVIKEMEGDSFQVEIKLGTEDSLATSKVDGKGPH